MRSPFCISDKILSASGKKYLLENITDPASDLNCVSFSLMKMLPVNCLSNQHLFKRTSIVAFLIKKLSSFLFCMYKSTNLKNKARTILSFAALVQATF